MTHLLAQTLVDTSYEIHGEGQLHGLVILLAMLVGGAALLYWLRRERTKGWAGKALTATTIALVLLAGYLAWQPTLVRIDRWQHPADVVVVTDQSSSMGARMAGDDLTSNLDLLAFWQPDAVAGRPMAVHELLTALDQTQAEADNQLNALQAVQAQIEQGVPLGQTSRDSLSAYGDWLKKTQQALGPKIEAADRLIDQQQTGDNARRYDAHSEAIAALATHLAQMGVGGLQAAPSAEAIGQRIDALTTLLTRMADVRPLMAELQAELDATWVAENQQAVEQTLQQVNELSRSDIASSLLPVIPGRRGAPGPAVMPTVDTRQTDLYNAMADQLAQANEVVSHMVLLSDGGHNAGPDPGVIDKLQRDGVQLTVVGIGQTGNVPDYALVDWRATRLAEEDEDTVVEVDIKLPQPTGAGGPSAGGDSPEDSAGADEGPKVLLLDAAGETLAETGLPIDAQTDGIATVRLPFEAPGEGRHVLTVRLTADDANAANNSATFVLDTSRRSPRVIVVGHQPDWDTAYLYQAMRHGRYDARQMFPGTTTEEPKRGGSSSSIPESASQWSRQRAVFLHDQPFQGFSDEDAATLHEYVVERGGSLVIFANPDEPTAANWQTALAAPFGWSPSAVPASDAHLRLAPEAYHLPITRLATDGPSSARIYAQLGACESAAQVPAQHQTLLTNAAGEPIMTLGFYGSGRVYFVGFAGWHKVSVYDGARHLDRLLAQLVGEAASPLMAEGNAIASYPTLPVAGEPNWLVTNAESGSLQVAGQADLNVQSGQGNRMAQWTPPQAGPVAASVGEQTVELRAVSNPGLEQVFYEFNEPFLASLAEQADGRYLPMTEAGSVLASIELGTWQSATADRTPLANHWLLLVLFSAIAAAHWTFRKLAGLAI